MMEFNWKSTWKWGQHLFHIGWSRKISRCLHKMQLVKSNLALNKQIIINEKKRKPWYRTANQINAMLVETRTNKTKKHIVVCLPKPLILG